MKHSGRKARNGCRRLFLATIGTAALAVPIVAGALTPPRLRAQAPVVQPPTPQWQVDAGGKMAFDVASVKQDLVSPTSAQARSSNVSLGPEDRYAPTGGLLSAKNWPLLQYIVFAYKLSPSQTQATMSQLPKWANTNRYDIQAHASGNPTKDQFRLMMQDLLANRFKLAIHYETKQLPVFALVLEKPGKLGPQLQLHPEDSPCSAAPTADFPIPCGALVVSNQPHTRRVSARNMSIGLIASSLVEGNMDRPVLDQTGLSGNFDFSIEFTPEPNGPLPPTPQPEESGPTFVEALKEQLGLKLLSQTGALDVLVVDHIEEPSPN
jgi:uncharacterized protein (TIGR03435 family)